MDDLEDDNLVRWEEYCREIMPQLTSAPGRDDGPLDPQGSWREDPPSSRQLAAIAHAHKAAREGRAVENKARLDAALSMEVRTKGQASECISEIAKAIGYGYRSKFWRGHGPREEKEKERQKKWRPLS